MNLPTKSQAFPREARLSRAADFQRVFAKPYKSADRYLTVLACAGNAATARLGLAIAKKRIRKAVHRNRIKRLVRESFRLHRAQLDHLDVVVLARDAAAQADNRVLANSLRKHWQRLANSKSSA